MNESRFLLPDTKIQSEKKIFNYDKKAGKGFSHKWSHYFVLLRIGMRLQLLVLLSWLSALIAAAYAAQKAVQPQGTAPKTNLTGHQKLAKLDEQLKTFSEFC